LLADLLAGFPTDFFADFLVDVFADFLVDFFVDFLTDALTDFAAACSAIRALTSACTNAAGNGLSAKNRIVPLLVSYDLSSFMRVRMGSAPG
jgi:hypothetical protein